MSENGMPELPKGWVRATIGDVVEPSKNRANPARMAHVPYIGLEHIEKETGRLLGHGYSDDVRSTKSPFSAGDLLYGKLRPYLNKVHIAAFDGVCSTDILVFPKSAAIANEYLAYRLLAGDFVRYANQNVSGVQHPRVSFTALSQFPFPLPPLPEQQRIVAKVEELFTQLDAGVAALRKAQAQLRRYRQAVLKHAFEGSLTAEWRETHKAERGPHKELPPLDTSELPELPEGWAWASLAVVCDEIQDGTHFSPKEQYSTPGPGRYVYVTSKNIKPDGVDLSNVSYVDAQTHRIISARCSPRKGDVLLIKDGVKTGVAAVNTLEEQFSLLSSVALLRVKRDVLSGKFLKYFLDSPAGFKMVAGGMSGTAIRRIILARIRASHVPVPPLAEQGRIVEETERRFSIAGEVEKTVERSLRQAERLRQSILKRAFEGRLVPQGPSDEPAEKLLQRIKAEKAKSEAEPKSLRTTRKRAPRGAKERRLEPRQERLL